MIGARLAFLRFLPALLLALFCCTTKATAYSAVAVASDLAYGYCYDMASKGEAESCALEWCRDYSSEPASCTVGVSETATGFYAFAAGDSGWGVGVGADSGSAQSSALGFCRQHSRNCSIDATWQESLGSGSEMETTQPLQLIDPRRAIFLILTHGSDQEFIPDVCHLDQLDTWQGTSRAIAAMDGMTLGGKTVFLDRFCTPSKVGSDTTLKVQLRKADLATRVAAYRRQGVPAAQIFLIGHSAGGWAELLLKAEQPGLFNAVVAIAPAFAGEEIGRDATWQKRRDKLLKQLATAADLSALILSFEGDSYEEPQDLAALALARNTVFRAITRSEQESASCHSVAHEILFDPCFAPTWGPEIVDYLNDRLP